MALFAAVAVPWHVAVAMRNPGWAQFYFVHEHWLRFTTTIHGRHQPWWFFVPIVAVGLFPWLGFVASGLRAALAGGWARRKENADAWFLAIWTAFVFLFFSKSQSKLIPYILPVFPPLAVLAGVVLIAAVKSRRSRIGVHVFAGFCGLLGAALWWRALFAPAALAPVALSPSPTRLVSGLDPDFGDKWSKKSITFREAGGVPDADLHGLPLANGQVDSEEMAATHTDFMGGEDDRTGGLVVGQLGAKEKRIG